MPIEVHPIDQVNHRQAWLDLRRPDVTASVLPALFGCHPYKITELRLYAEKRGVEFPELPEDDPVLRRGRWLEPAVAVAVQEKHPGWRVVKASEYYRDPELRMGATPDFFIEGDPRGRGVLQTKSVAKSVYMREWDNGAHVPFYVVLQTLDECMLTDAAFGVAAALLVDAHGMDCTIHEIPRHPAGEAKIVAVIKQFWWRVDNGIEPQPDFSSDAEVIRALAPKEVKGKAFVATGNNYLAATLAQRASLSARIRADRERVDEIEAELKYLLRDAEFITGLPGWSVTYKSGLRKGYTVEPHSIRTLRILDKRPPEERPQQGGDDDEDA